MNTGARRIVITGFMCAGKTTVARALAARLGCAMLDTDERIAERAGRSIAAIIDEDGEARGAEDAAAEIVSIVERGNFAREKRT